MTEPEFRRLERLVEELGRQFSQKFSSMERKMTTLEAEVHTLKDASATLATEVRASAEFRSNLGFLWRVILGLAGLAVAGTTIFAVLHG